MFTSGLCSIRFGLRARRNCDTIRPGLPAVAADAESVVVYHRLGDALHIGRVALLSLGNRQVARAPIVSVTEPAAEGCRGLGVDRRKRPEGLCCERGGDVKSRERESVIPPPPPGLSRRESLGGHATFWLLDFVTVRVAREDNPAASLRFCFGHYGAFANLHVVIALI